MCTVSSSREILKSTYILVFKAQRFQMWIASKLLTSARSHNFAFHYGKATIQQLGAIDEEPQWKRRTHPPTKTNKQKNKSSETIRRVVKQGQYKRVMVSIVCFQVVFFKFSAIYDGIWLDLCLPDYLSIYREGYRVTTDCVRATS